MAYDFPSVPALDQVFITPDGRAYIWNGYGWSGGPSGPPPVDAYTKAESDTNFVNVPGDTMTGTLDINGGNISATGTATLTGNTTLNNTANIAGAVQMNSTLNVAGATTINNNYNVNGATASFAGNLRAGNSAMVAPSYWFGLMVNPGLATNNLLWDSSTYLAFGYNVGDLSYFRANSLHTHFRQDWVFQIYGAPYCNGGGAWNANSDIRIKTVTGDYTQGLDTIKQINPVRYVYKGNDLLATASNDDLSVFRSGEVHPKSPNNRQASAGTEFIGLVAQDVEIVMPEMVTRDAAFIDGVAVTDMRILNANALTYALINAVKELSAINSGLTTRVAALEGAR